MVDGLFSGSLRSIEAALDVRALRHELLAANIAKANLQARAFLGQTSIKVRDLMSLEEGDLIQLPKLATEDLHMQVEGKNKFAGRIGQFRGQKAFKISRPSRPGEDL